MDRGASAGFLTELAQAKNSPVYLVDVYFDSSTDRMTDAYKSLTIGGHTYNAFGHFLGFSGLSETEGMNIPNVTISISGIDQSWIATALDTDFLDRSIVISKTFIDSTGLVTIDPVVIFDGRMDGMSIQDDPNGTTTVSITATNQFADFNFAPGRHTNMAEQQFFFPTDLFFEFASSVTPDITWGTK
jgi:hypothetical protein